MRLIYNVLVLLLATTALAAPVPSRSNDVFTDVTSTGEHSLVHHHHMYHSKHAKHIAHPDEPEVAAISLLNDLEERSFYDKDYLQFERRQENKVKKLFKVAGKKMVNASQALKLWAKPSQDSFSPEQPVNHPTHVGQPVNPNYGNRPSSHLARLDRTRVDKLGRLIDPAMLRGRSVDCDR